MVSRKRTHDSDTASEPANKKARRGERATSIASKTSQQSKKAGKAKAVSTRPSRSRSASQPDSQTQDSSLEEEIRCVCGSDVDNGNTVFCESCRTWQHIACYYPDFAISQVHVCVNCSGEEEEEDGGDDDDNDDDDVEVLYVKPVPKKKIGPLVPARKYAAKSKSRKKTPDASAAVAAGPSAKGKGKEKAGPDEEKQEGGDEDTLKARWFTVNVDLEEVLGPPTTEREARLYGLMRELVMGNRELAEQVTSLANAMLKWRKKFDLMLRALLEEDEV